MRGHATVIEQAKIAGGNSAHVYKFELASLNVLLDGPTPPRLDELGMPPLLTRRPRACRWLGGAPALAGSGPG
jgi:hypothetical protein